MTHDSRREEGLRFLFVGVGGSVLFDMINGSWRRDFSDEQYVDADASGAYAYVASPCNQKLR